MAITDSLKKGHRLPFLSKYDIIKLCDEEKIKSYDIKQFVFYYRLVTGQGKKISGNS